MSIDEFVAALAEVRDMPWTATMRLVPGCIRAVDHCPLTALAERRGHGCRVGVSQFEAAAIRLGIKVSDQNRIVAAIDDRGEDALRRRIMAALGIHDGER